MAVSSMNILIVEDHLAIAENIAQYFEPKGYILDFATNGPHGLALALENHYDVIILDLMLPGMDGIEVCQEIRKNASRHVPILMLTARDTITDKVSGFRSGADDYLTKPFSLEELEVRCLALSKRHLLQLDNKISIADLVIDRVNKVAYRNQVKLNLNSMNFNILLILAEAYPKTVTRSELSHRLWGDEPTTSDSLRSHIYQLRQILDKPYESALLKTTHGVGFSLEVTN